MALPSNKVVENVSLIIFLGCPSRPGSLDCRAWSLGMKDEVLMSAHDNPVINFESSRRNLIRLGAIAASALIAKQRQRPRMTFANGMTIIEIETETETETEIAAGMTIVVF